MNNEYIENKTEENEMEVKPRVWIERTKRAAAVTDEYVHGHPWTAIGVGAVLGLAIGCLIALGCRKS